MADGRTDGRTDGQTSGVDDRDEGDEWMKAWGLETARAGAARLALASPGEHVRQTAWKRARAAHLGWMGARQRRPGRRAPRRCQHTRSAKAVWEAVKHRLFVGGDTHLGESTKMRRVTLPARPCAEHHPSPGGSAPGEEVLTEVFSYYILMTESIRRRTTSSDGERGWSRREGQAVSPLKS